MNIELLVVADCPHEPAAADLLRAALSGLGLPPEGFRTTVITNEQEAMRRAFTGSPTFLINGIDPFAEPDRPVGLSCRIYRHDGIASGLPQPEALIDALTCTAAHARPATTTEGRPR
ncbi:hypothetical protein SMIR_40825 (plasmid) [Streptomyces mirabilis]|uniref:hypothetical protein n=1 Tax=Streptomyces mirabilis TaxID=68239 RepID=UPI001BB00513|nr:hypothetical protein [Streptomyces mirabilis]QUW85430.1 hypothetical protein SMIR_40825 [Streptomyces mirabilis]